MTFVRHGLPALICLGGILVIVFNPGQAGAEGGMLIISAGLSVWLLNILFRLGVRGDTERDAEDEARAYFDRHGRWPDDPPPPDPPRPPRVHGHGGRRRR